MKYYKIENVAKYVQKSTPISMVDITTYINVKNIARKRRFCLQKRIILVTLSNHVSTCGWMPWMRAMNANTKNNTSKGQKS